MEMEERETEGEDMKIVVSCRVVSVMRVRSRSRAVGPTCPSIRNFNVNRHLRLLLSSFIVIPSTCVSSLVTCCRLAWIGVDDR